MTGGKIMKTKAILYSALALLAIACTKETLVENNENNQNENTDVEYTSLELFATIEGSKTELGENGKVNWLAGDAISIFDTATGANTRFTTTGNGWFTSESDVPVSETYYALYWYRSAASWKTNVMQSKLFPDQIAKVGSFGDEVPYMAGKVDLVNKRIEFKNICSHIGFTLSEELAASGVKSLTLMGNNSETLCGTMQISIDAEGNPSVKVTDPDIYVRLHKNGENLEAGTYYFSIVPQTFSAGFTVIVSKADGSQVAVKTDKNITEVSTRNSILPMSVPAAESYKPHLNYFVKYLDGFDVTVGDTGRGGYKFNKTTHSKYIMKTDGKSNKTINADGLYFVDNNSNNITLSYNTVNNLIICSIESKTKAKIEFGKSLQPATNQNGIVIIENMLLTSISTVTDIMTQKKSDSNPGTNFGMIIFDNCIIKDLKRHLVNISNAATKIESFCISNCDISTTASSSYCLTFGNSLESSLNKLFAYNNVFYYSGNAESTPTDFKIANTSKSTIENLYVVSNTFDKVIIPNAGLVWTNKMNNCQVLKNVFNETIPTSANATIVKAATTQPTNVTVIQNYYYTSGETKLNVPSEIRPSGSNGITGSVGTPVKLRQSPLYQTWEPANGTYGPYTIIPTEGDAPTQQMGAVRWDTVPVANTAAYRFAPNELGSF